MNLETLIPLLVRHFGVITLATLAAAFAVERGLLAKLGRQRPLIAAPGLVVLVAVFWLGNQLVQPANGTTTQAHRVDLHLQQWGVALALVSVGALMLALDHVCVSAWAALRERRAPRATGGGTHSRGERAS